MVDSLTAFTVCSDHPEGRGGTQVFPVPLGNYTLPQGGLNVNTFFAIFSNFFLEGIASYSQLYMDHK